MPGAEPLVLWPMSKEIWFTIWWFTCSRKNAFHAYRWTSALLFHQLDSAFLESDNWLLWSTEAMGFFQAMQKYKSVERPLSLSACEFSIIRSKSIPRDTQSACRAAALRAVVAQGAWELGLCSVRLRTDGRFSKTWRQTVTNSLELLGSKFPSVLWKASPPSRAVFRGTGWHSLKILPGWISSKRKDSYCNNRI